MSQRVDISSCKSVCLALGPYRNLTTLTAATLFLHPSCQVLNHAGVRIFGNSRLDFLADYTEERFADFIKFGIHASSKGQRGRMGGSIVHSHAFDAGYEMKQVYERTGLGLTKERIQCLFWKEPLRTANWIRQRRIDLPGILEKEPRLRFLLPIRNPMDCARSNLKTGHVDLFKGLGRSSSILEVVRAILDEIHWFASYKERFSDRFFYFFEHGVSSKMLTELATFLSLDPNEAWLSDALSVMVTRSHYQHDAELVACYRDAVRKRFSRFPALCEGLLAFN